MNLRDEYGDKVLIDAEISVISPKLEDYIDWLEIKLEEERFIKNIVKLKVNDLYMYLKGGKE